MKISRITAILFYFFLVISSSTLLAQPAKAWKYIFDGKSFNGWTFVESPANVVIADSAFLIRMTANTTRHVYLRTNKQYRNFILELDCRRDTSFDSGILFRAISTPDTAKVGLYGYMVKIDPSLVRRWTGGVFLDYGGTGIEWLHPLEGNQQAQQAERVGEWNRFRIEAKNEHIKVWINGVPTTNMMSQRFMKGFIALKIHYLQGTPWNEKMSASFKNIRIINSPKPGYYRSMDLPVKMTQ